MHSHPIAPAAAAWLIACVRSGANCIHALHFEVTEDTVMPVAAFFLRKEPEEQKHVAYRHAVIAQMGLSGTGLTEGEPMLGLRRRQFITLLGGAAAWPIAARAQQSGQLAKVGVLYPGLASTLPSRIAAFREGLQTVGYREPDNVALILRSSDGDSTRIPSLAMDLVERKVDVIVAVSAPAVKAARSATANIPIVAFDLESDPMASRLIDSFSRPGGQVTGVFFDFPEFSKKWLELLKEAMPQLSSVAVLWDPATGRMQMKGVEIAGKELKVKLEIFEVSDLSNLDDAILTASGKGVDAILMLSSPVFGTNPERIAGLTIGARLPAVTLFPDFARAGGLMAYGVNPPNIFRQGAAIVAKVLRGAKPGEVPAELPTKFELVINLKTAKRLGIVFPTAILLRADEVIE